MSDRAKSQYIVLCAQVVGNMQDGFDIVYNWSHEFHDTRKAAIKSGWKERESDDFNIGVVRNGRLVSLDWMNEAGNEPPETLRKIEEQIYLVDEDEEADPPHPAPSPRETKEV